MFLVLRTIKDCTYVLQASLDRGNQIRISIQVFILVSGDLVLVLANRRSFNASFNDLSVLRFDPSMLRVTNVYVVGDVRWCDPLEIAFTQCIYVYGLTVYVTFNTCSTKVPLASFRPRLYIFTLSRIKYNRRCSFRRTQSYSVASGGSVLTSEFAAHQVASTWKLSGAIIV